MLGRRRFVAAWAPALFLGACGGAAADEAPTGSAFFPAMVPSHLSRFQLRAELCIAALALEPRSQSAVQDSFGSHLPIVESVLAASFGYSAVRATGILLTAGPVCGSPAPREIDAGLVIPFTAEGQGAALRLDGGLTEAIDEAMRGVDGGISVLSSCVSYLAWTESDGGRPSALGRGDDDRPQAQIRRAPSRAAVKCLQLAAVTVSCFVLGFVLAQFSGARRSCAAPEEQERELDPAPEQAAEQSHDCDSSDLELSILSPCQKGHRAVSQGTRTPGSTQQSDVERSPPPDCDHDCSDGAGLQSEQHARYL